ncbi:MAG: hypothetical protein HY814_06730 [Candidatus Riflebacteria bacterium]|nr:hypothetical protein [Candidatus Riflebacteria bacterium]
MPPDEMRRAEPFVDCGVVFLLTVMRPGTPVGAQSRQMLERATKLAVRAGTALLDPARDGVWDADLLDGLLQALRLLGAHSTALDLCIQAMPAYVKPGIASARLSSFRAELIRFEVEFARIRLQLRPDDLASTTTERQECLRALVALRDRMLLGWPRSPEALRALLPQSARSPDEVQALLMASQRRLSRLRDALRRVTEKLELEMPPEPQGGHPGPGMR